MQNDIDKIYEKLLSLETELQNLRQGYVSLNQEYAAAVSSLNSLTINALEASKRAVIAAEKAL